MFCTHQTLWLHLQNRMNIEFLFALVYHNAYVMVSVACIWNEKSENCKASASRSSGKHIKTFKHSHQACSFVSNFENGFTFLLQFLVINIFICECLYLVRKKSFKCEKEKCINNPESTWKLLHRLEQHEIRIDIDTVEQSRNASTPESFESHEPFALQAYSC